MKSLDRNKVTNICLFNRHWTTQHIFRSALERFTWKSSIYWQMYSMKYGQDKGWDRMVIPWYWMITMFMCHCVCSRFLKWCMSVKHIIVWSFFAVVIFFRLVSPNQFLFCKGRRVNTSVKMLCIYFHPLGVNRILEAILTLTKHCSPQ